jgi:predicted Zn-dependent protease|tara:strand:+ start:1919 stop:3346 length:1428 start_codon:yes stop_codon:yes gene_type:complete
MKKITSLFLFLIFSGCSVNPVTGQKDFVMMSENQEISLGKKYHAQVLQQTPSYKDQELQDYVQGIGDSLSIKSHRPNLFYRFTVLDSPEINAFALPGGYIYINRGLMAYLSSEEELAAVLGHEIGHVTARHSVRQYSQSQLLGILSTAVQMNSGRTAGDIVGVASGALLAGYGREMELEADELGAKYIHQDGYSTDGMMSVLSVLKNQEIYSKELAKERGQEPRNYHGVFASHPSNDKRLKEILEEVSKAYRQVDIKKTTDYVEKINEMVYGDSEESGVRKGNEFFHKDLDLYLASPQDWEIINTSKNIIFRAPYSKAMLNVSLEDLNFRESPKEYMKRVASNFSEGTELEINGYKGYACVVRERTGQIRRLAVLFREGKVYQFVGYLDEEEKDFQQYDPAFMQIINSLDRLDKRGRAMSKPLRIKRYIVRQGDTYKKLANNSAISYNAEEQLRLLNGDYPDQALVVGQVIKLVW